jgi:hypothetical protein
VEGVEASAGLMARTVAIWISGLLASAIIGGGIGSHVHPYDGEASGAVAGLLAFTCLRLWVRSRSGFARSNASRSARASSILSVAAVTTSSRLVDRRPRGPVLQRSLCLCGARHLSPAKLIPPPSMALLASSIAAFSVTMAWEVVSLSKMLLDRRPSCPLRPGAGFRRTSFRAASQKR